MQFLKIMNRAVKKIKLIVLHKVVLQLLGWTALYLFAAEIFISGLDKLITLIAFVQYIIVSYINTLLLVPYFFRRDKYWLYAFLVLGDVILGAFLSFIFYYYIFSFLLPEDLRKNIGTLSFFVLQIFLNLLFIGFTSYLKFIIDAAKLNKVTKKVYQIEKEKIEAELKALKAQINPHFLFNSLNNIYSLSLVNSDQTPSVILKLSDILRYMLYECNEQYVSLEKELNYLKNYVELQKIRLKNNSNVSFSVNGNAQDYKISPLLFTTLIENAFKYGNNSNPEDSLISIIFTIEKDKIVGTIKNSIEKEDNVENEKSGGIGLKNLKRRLDILYPDNYNFDCEEENDRFKAKLIVPLR